jgi:hypothetical protein
MRDHVTPDACNVIVVLGNNSAEFTVGILGGEGWTLGNVE